MEQELKFLKTLARNNNREWFEKNKAVYLEVKDHFEKFIGTLLNDMTAFDPSLSGLNPRKLIFRIYRDVRFSKDKRPYKTNMGASISPTGKGIGRPGYYLHIEPGGKSILAAGLYMPDAENLAKIRQEIDYNGKKLKAIFSTPSVRKIVKDFWGDDTLNTGPKGYAKDHPDIKWLKLKSFIVIHELSDEAVKRKSFGKDTVKKFATLKPLNDFLTEAIN